MENSGIDKRLILKCTAKGENGEVGSIIFKWIIKKGGKVYSSSMSRRIDYCEYGNAHSGKKKVGEFLVHVTYIFKESAPCSCSAITRG